MKLKEQILGPIDKEPVPKDWKMIGFFGSPDMNSKLTLLATAMGLDKSKLLRKIVTDWLAEHNAVELTVKKIRELKSTPEGHLMETREFKSKVRAYLEDRKVSPDLIEKVLKDVK